MRTFGTSPPLGCVRSILPPRGLVGAASLAPGSGARPPYAVLRVGEISIVIKDAAAVVILRNPRTVAGLLRV
jgi:hypothetical protein